MATCGKVYLSLWKQLQARGKLRRGDQYKGHDLPFLDHACSFWLWNNAKGYRLSISAENPILSDLHIQEAWFGQRIILSGAVGSDPDVKRISGCLGCLDRNAGCKWRGALVAPSERDTYMIRCVTFLKSGCARKLGLYNNRRGVRE